MKHYLMKMHPAI